MGLKAACSNSIPIRCIEEIPPDATSQDSFQVSVEVIRITERETAAGDPFWFVKCEDEQLIRFDVVVWESQMRRLGLEEGMNVAIDVRIPKEPYTAYTLVEVKSVV
jgi:transcription termination factor Rho